MGEAREYSFEGVFDREDETGRELPGGGAGVHQGRGVREEEEPGEEREELAGLFRAADGPGDPGEEGVRRLAGEEVAAVEEEAGLRRELHTGSHGPPPLITRRAQPSCRQCLSSSLEQHPTWERA